MPEVLFYYRSKLRPGHASELAETLPRIISPVLGTKASAIKINCVPTGLCDVNQDDIRISITAHNYPERLENCQKIVDLILAAVKRWLGEKIEDRSYEPLVILNLCNITYAR